MAAALLITHVRTLRHRVRDRHKYTHHTTQTHRHTRDRHAYPTYNTHAHTHTGTPSCNLKPITNVLIIYKMCKKFILAYLFTLSFFLWVIFIFVRLAIFHVLPHQFLSFTILFSNFLQVCFSVFLTIFDIIVFFCGTYFCRSLLVNQINNVNK